MAAKVTRVSSGPNNVKFQEFSFDNTLRADPGITRVCGSLGDKSLTKVMQDAFGWHPTDTHFGRPKTNNIIILIKESKVCDE